MTRLEFKEGTSNKFWEIEPKGAANTVRWGRIGTPGQEKRFPFPNAASARAEAERLIAEKKKKGYREVGGKDAAKKAQAINKASPRNADLEKLIAGAPFEVEAYLVYADWLSGAGDPRGELITIQHSLSTMAAAERKSPRGKALAARATQILKQNQRFLPGVSPELVTITWRWGFIESVHFDNNDDWMSDDYQVVPVVKQVLASPAVVSLTELHVGVQRWDRGEKDVPAVLKTVGASPVGAQIRRLDVGPAKENDIDTAHYTPGKLDGISEYFPALESLRVHGAGFTLGALELPKLRDLTIETCGLSRRNMKSITAARWPELERLDLWFGSEDHGAQCGVKDLEAILDGAAFPRVKHLGLRNAEFTDALCKALPKARILKQLETLDLSMGTMSDEGARSLAAAPQALRHLATITVTDNFLTRAGIAALRKLGPTIVSKEQKDFDDDDPSYRYVSVAE